MRNIVVYLESELDSFCGCHILYKQYTDGNMFLPVINGYEVTSDILQYIMTLPKVDHIWILGLHVGKGTIERLRTMYKTVNLYPNKLCITESLCDRFNLKQKDEEDNEDDGTEDAITPDAVKSDYWKYSRIADTIMAKRHYINVGVKHVENDYVSGLLTCGILNPEEHLQARFNLFDTSNCHLLSVMGAGANGFKSMLIAEHESMSDKYTLLFKGKCYNVVASYSSTGTIGLSLASYLAAENNIGIVVNNGVAHMYSRVVDLTEIAEHYSGLAKSEFYAVCDSKIAEDLVRNEE